MKLRTYGIAAAFALAAAGCSDSPTSPSETSTRFTATLLPANEVPPVSNADASGSGTVTVTLKTTRDSSGNITAATADFEVSLTGFPANTVLTGAHIHQAPAGSNSGVIWNTGLTNGEIVLANGSGSFTKTGTTIGDGASVAQAIINDPAGFYFNVHTTLNTAGAARGQLVR
jgi:hypothetical protein